MELPWAATVAAGDQQHLQKIQSAGNLHATVTDNLTLATGPEACMLLTPEEVPGLEERQRQGKGNTSGEVLITSESSCQMCQRLQASSIWATGHGWEGRGGGGGGGVLAGPVPLVVWW